jgi:hypothetical protein
MDKAGALAVINSKACPKFSLNFNGRPQILIGNYLLMSHVVMEGNSFAFNIPGSCHIGFTGTQMSTTNFPSLGSSGYISKHGFSSG